ncbi:calcitonin gene-related peptide type 1 receptor-like isoform X3 [Pseudomyrmex gracilis]|uniref:calcitonin gene-related peptide type 1 receptor-like isoform X3 n=1 Tax=Pseudomyrmex gracilis TaxID=219809 RepID=UPI0009952B07|nr:calcitonin gene-related peptide type 1 receptor-like isoform X3 [Pseudomyrmex gracilis]
MYIKMAGDKTGPRVIFNGDEQDSLDAQELECQVRLGQWTPPSDPYCPPDFDGLRCWNATLGGTTAFANCPAYVVGFESSRIAYRYCEPNGTWYWHPAYGRQWTNYTNCVDMSDEPWYRNITVMYEVGYVLSTITLFISLAIFARVQCIQCPRITVHKHLFSSITITNIMLLIWHWFIMTDLDLVADNNIVCVVYHVVLQYFLVSNYSWMLCEGIYLHTILVSTFIDETDLVHGLIIWGWIFPVPIVTAYTALRATSKDPEDTELCWSSSGNYINVMSYPVLLTTTTNVFFTANIIRVLLKKLKGQASRVRRIFRATRAAIFLTPVLGLQYFVVAVRPAPQHPWEPYHEILHSVTAGYQGLWVSILLCFGNSEVKTALQRIWWNSDFRRKISDSIELRQRSSSLAPTVSDTWLRKFETF